MTLLFIARGFSMDPLIRQGDVLMVKPAGPSDICLGDILAFRDKSSKVIIAHRLIKMVSSAQGTSYILRGDANQEGSDEVASDAIVGKVIGVKKKDTFVALECFGDRVLKYIGRALPASGGLIIFLLQWRSVGLLSLAKIKTRMSVFFLTRLQGLKIYRALAKKFCPLRLTLRGGGVADQEQLKDLYNITIADMRKSFSETIRQGFFFLAEEKNGGVLGSLALGRHDNAGLWLMSGLKVRPLFRGLGIGEKIVTRALAEAKKKGAFRVGLFVNSQAVPAVNLYAKVGFKESLVYPVGISANKGETYLVILAS